jgi:hypothetical protein
VKVLASDGSQWLKDIMEDDMSFDHKPHNPNHGGITRSGRTTGFDHTSRHPSDNRLNWADWLLIVAIFAGLLCVVFGVTIWSDVPMGGVR